MAADEKRITSIDPALQDLIDSVPLYDFMLEVFGLGGPKFVLDEVLEEMERKKSGDENVSRI